MVDLRSSGEVRTAMRQVFGAAAKLDPNTITASAVIRQPPPPADNLNLPPQTVPGLVMECAHRLLGRKITGTFDKAGVRPDALARQTFRPLADPPHAHFNTLAESALC